jgi:Isoleucyl-tRNA synthetase
MVVYPRTGHGDVPAQPDFPALEREVLDYWEAGDTFRESIRQRPADDEFVFYDGPPFANGLPHYGHLITGYVKDLVPRFRTMQGSAWSAGSAGTATGCPPRWRPNGCSASPASRHPRHGRREVQPGLPRVRAALHAEWQDYVTRQARWVDFEHDYKTLDLPYMESVMWAFRQLWDKGLVYQGFKVLPYCWRCETPLSNHELRMDDDTYAERQDPSVTSGSGWRPGSGCWPGPPRRGRCRPTWPARSARTSSYVVVEKDGERYILARDRQAPTSGNSRTPPPSAR